MGTHTAWQALRQRPRRFLASPWPWRSLAYLLCGIVPSGALAAAVLALLASRSSNAAPVVLPPVALALLLSGPAMARYEHWRLRLMQVDPAPPDRTGGPKGPTAPSRSATASSARSRCG